MVIEKCHNCAPKEFRKWNPDGWWMSFFHTPKERLDLLECEHCGGVYQFSWIQSFVLYILLTFLFILANFLGQIPIFGYGFFFGTIILLYPLAFEIPRRYFPWKETDVDLYYVRWKSVARLVLAHVLGWWCGDLLSIVIW